MKHPALTRVLAVTLAVFCLVTLIAGSGALVKARKDHREDLRQQALLRERIDRAAALSARLEAGQADYDKASDGLEALREAHDKDASAYRGKLATYTATRGGLVMGKETMDAAAAALQAGARQFDQGYALFEKVAMAFEEVYLAYQTASWSIEEGWGTYYEGAAYLEAGLVEELGQLMTPQQVLSAVTATREGVSGLKDVIRAAAEQPSDGTAAAESLQRLMTQLSEASEQTNGFDAATLANRAVQAAIDRADAQIEARRAEGLSEEEAAAEADALCQAAVGMSYAEARAWLRDNPLTENTAQGGGLDLSGLDAAQLQALIGEFGGQEDLLDKALAILEEEELAMAEQEEAMRADPEAMSSSEALLKLLKTELTSSEKILALVSEAMENGRSTMEKLAGQMSMARKAIEAGRRGIDQGRKQLRETEEDLHRQFDEMTDEKKRLETEQLSLDERQEITDAFEADKKEFSSARAVLMDYDDVKAAVDAGGELLESAENELSRMRERQQREYVLRVLLAVVMLSAAAVAAIGVAGAFERPKLKRLWLPPALCAALGTAGEAGSLMLGRGLWYSVLFLVLTALALLPLTIEKKV